MYPHDVLKMIGYLETGAGLGLTTGPIIGSSLFALWGFNTPFWAFSGIFILLGLISLILVPQDNHKESMSGSLVGSGTRSFKVSLHSHNFDDDRPQISYWKILNSRFAIFALLSATLC